MKNNKYNILILGENSYIGNSFKKYIEKYYNNSFDIDTISLRNNNWKNLDFSIYDVVLNFIGIAHVDIDVLDENDAKKYFDINTYLNYEVAKKSKIDGVKQYIYMSSSIVYGDVNKINEPKIIKNNTLPSPSNFYGESKLKAEELLNELCDKNFVVSIVRSPMVYGANSKGNFAKLYNFSKNIILFPKIDNIRSMIYIDNLSEFLVKTIEYKKSGILFPQNNEYVNTSDLVLNIAMINNKKIVITSIFNPFMLLLCKFSKKINKIVLKVFGSFVYDKTLSQYEFDYNKYSFLESLRSIKENDK